MRPEFQVKQYVATVRGALGRFAVYRTGTSHYLFCQLDAAGCATGLVTTKHPTDLQPDVRRALAHAWGHRSP